MRLSAFSVVDAYDDDPPSRDRLGEVLLLADAAEHAGLSTVWVAEHHFHAGGVCPSPPVLLTAIAARTHRIRIGSLVSVLPFHNAVDLAEQYAMVDRLSGGRLNLGVGSGYIPLEFEGFGVDPATKRERFDVGLATLLGGLQGEAIVPSPTLGPRRLNVAPVQRPYPPIWIAVQRRDALPFVARRGVSVALVPYATVGSLGELAEQIREFRSHLPPGAEVSVSVALHLYAGERPERARTALQRYLDSRLATQSAFYQDKVRRDPRHASAATIERTGFAAFGAPTEVVSQLESFRQAGVDEVLGIFDFGGLSVADVRASIEALGPTFRAP
ncbi:MAG: LLM class flavin-dependent oxidoreductase [Thermoplasmata archaeon]|nr:LLM class flavin-dependent oxidoreductase [Thermoplasmata archaeon]